MKSTAMRALLPAALFALVLGACQKNVDTAAESDLRAGTKRSNANCATVCVNEGEYSDPVTKGPFTGSNGGATITVDISNSHNMIKYVIKSNDNIGRINWSGGQIEYSPVLTPVNGVTTVTLTKPIGVFGVNWQACTNFAETIEVRKTNSSGVGGGVLTTVDASYNAVGVCPPPPPVCDEEYFAYSTTDNLNITFSYSAPEALQNATVQFTFPQILNISQNGTYTAPDGKVYTVNNQGNNTVFTWTGNIGCKVNNATTFVFSVQPDCNSSGKAQIWTDFKVNGVSKKNIATPNIVYNCSGDDSGE